MLLKSKFFWRTFLSYSLVIGLVVLVFATLAAKNYRLTILSDVDDNLHVQAQFLSLSISDNTFNQDIPIIQEQILLFTQYSENRFTVISSSGVVLADTHESPESMDNHLSRPEIQDALAGGAGRAKRFSKTLGREYRYYALPIYNNGDLIGVVRSALPSQLVQLAVNEAYRRLLSYGLVTLLLGLLLVLYLSVRRALAVEEMSKVAEVISEGDFERRLPVDNDLGLGKLAQEINQLARNSAERVALITADRNRLATIFAGMVEGVIDVDQEQRIVHINEVAANILGLSSVNSTGKEIWQEIRDNEITHAIDTAIKTQSVIKTQTTFSRKSAMSVEDGIVEIYAASLSDDSGSPIGAIIVLNDVTELKNLERVRTDFVANASHELKTPITAIRGLSETILEDEQADRETALKFMDRIHAQSIRLSHLVTDLITISRLESSQREAEFSLINLTELIKRGFSVAEANSEEKNQTLSLNLGDEKIEVYGDNQNLSQLVDNLIDNAIKYTPEGGEIKLALFVEEEAAVFVVEDNGIGINSQYISRVFERFYRVDKARSQSLGGTGLGLSIVKNIAEKHGGSISVQSLLGRGSTFTFKINRIIN